MEKIYKQEDGSKVKIKVVAPFGFTRREGLLVSVSVCAKGKRKFHPVIDGDSHTWRGLSREDRAKDNKDRSLVYITEEQLKEVVSLWVEENKPSIDTLRFN